MSSSAAAISPIRSVQARARIMGRVLAILMFMAGICVYVNWQYRNVVSQITSPHGTRSALPTAKTPWSQANQESRTKCIICGGTGRSGFYVAGNNGRAGSTNNRRCSSCNGTGWVDNPLYGH
jgi:hypothetical protein